LRRLLPADPIELPREVQQNIDMESYRLQKTSSGRITLERKVGILDPQSTKGQAYSITLARPSNARNAVARHGQSTSAQSASRA